MTNISCPHCNNLINEPDTTICPNCKHSLSSRAPNFKVINHPQTLYSVYPPVQRNTWTVSDHAIQCYRGKGSDDTWFTDGTPGLITTGPHITLDIGMRGIEFQLSLNETSIDPNTHIATVQVTAFDGNRVLTEAEINAHELQKKFGGMYHGVRLNVFNYHFVDEVEFRILSTGEAPFHVHGFKLIPRPGYVWFANNLDIVPSDWEHKQNWEGIAVRPTHIRGPYATLDPDEYRVGIKFSPPEGITTGAIAECSATGIDSNRNPVTLVSPFTITAEDVLARHGIPDTKMRFRLEETHTDIELQIRILVSGVVLQWARIATGEESVWQHYYNLGGLDSPLGPPTSGYIPDPDSRSYCRGSVRHFEGGSIYWTVEHGPCQVYGAIARLYDSLGRTGGELGFPITRPQPTRSSTGRPGLIQTFQRGERQSLILSHTDSQGEERAFVIYPHSR